MSNIDQIIEGLKTTVASSVSEQAGQYVKQVSSDTNDFLTASKTDLELWIQQLADGELTKDDFASLVRGKESVAEMKALASAGMAAANVDKLRNALIQAVINAAVAAIP